MSKNPISKERLEEEIMFIKGKIVDDCLDLVKDIEKLERILLKRGV
tara:strand:+ start:503 stop:640 length:138 start_codon:yes stop_codon:yes gene_type:complete